MNCIICDAPDAPFNCNGFLNRTERNQVAAYYASFQDADGKPIFHTGHLRTELMELPLRVCEKHRGPILPHRGESTPTLKAYLCTNCGTQWFAHAGEDHSIITAHTESECRATRENP